MILQPTRYQLTIMQWVHLVFELFLAFKRELLLIHLFSYLTLLLHLIPFNFCHLFQSLPPQLPDFPFIIINWVDLMILLQLKHRLFNSLISQHFQDRHNLSILVKQFIINSLRTNVNTWRICLLRHLSYDLRTEWICLGHTTYRSWYPRVIRVDEIGCEVDGTLFLGFGPYVLDWLWFFRFVLGVVWGLILLFLLLHFVFLDVDGGVCGSFEDTFIDVDGDFGCFFFFSLFWFICNNSWIST